MKNIHIEGMSCNHCVMRVKKALENVPGVKSAEVILNDKKAEVLLDRDVEDNLLKKAVEEAGYSVISIKQ
jgi:copper ion binding protein